MEFFLQFFQIYPAEWIGFTSAAGVAISGGDAAACCAHGRACCHPPPEVALLTWAFTMQHFIFLFLKPGQLCIVRIVKSS